MKGRPEISFGNVVGSILAFFATKVGTDMAGSIPVIGDFLMRVIRGGPEGFRVRVVYMNELSFIFLTIIYRR